MAPPFEERPTPSSSLCLAGLKAPIGGSFYVGQTTFLTGWFPPFLSSAISLRNGNFEKATILQSSATLSSSGVAPQGHEPFLHFESASVSISGRTRGG